MTLDPSLLIHDYDLLEEIEKATARLVVRAITDFPFREIVNVFSQEVDKVADIGEDLTREALDRVGTSVIMFRLSGKMDYKRARYLFLPEYEVRQALLVDSKAEKNSTVARMQQGQTSMVIRQIRSGKVVDEPGGLTPTISHADGDLLTTTMFVKYSYVEEHRQKTLVAINVIALPNGMLQDRYNPTPEDNIWNADPNSPRRGEPFRTRINLRKLRAKASWRVQTVPADTSRRNLWTE